MRRKGLINELAELQRQGRYDEAKHLWEENTSADDREQFKRFQQALLGFIKSTLPQNAGDVDWEKTDDLLRKFRASFEDPDHRNSKEWLHLGDLTVRQVADFSDRLRDPRARTGRPVNSGPISEDDELLNHIERRVAESDKPPTTIAREVLLERGDGLHLADLKNRADYLVKKIKKRGKK